MPISNSNNVSVNINLQVSTVKKSSVQIGTSATKLLDFNNFRKGFALYNGSDKICYVDFSKDVTTQSFAFKLKPDGFYDSPMQYTGLLYAVCDGTSGQLEVREFTE